MLTENQARALMEKVLKGKYEIVSTREVGNLFVFEIDVPGRKHAFVDPLAIDKETQKIRVYSPISKDYK